MRQKLAVPAKSRNELREIANKVRRKLSLQSVYMFPAPEFLELLPIIMGNDAPDYDYIEDSEWNYTGTHAFFSPTDNTIFVKESIYLGACNGVGRDRMTLSHECGHVILKHHQLVMPRSFDETIPTYCDPEWQAKCFAGELMIPYSLTVGMSAEEIVNRCGVSYDAALYRTSL